MSPPAPAELGRSELVPDSAVTRRLDPSKAGGQVVDPQAIRLAGVEPGTRARDDSRTIELRFDLSGAAVRVWIEALAPGQTSEIRPHAPDWTLTPLLPE